jgi:hypothetical protein
MLQKPLQVVNSTEIGVGDQIGKWAMHKIRRQSILLSCELSRIYRFSFRRMRMQIQGKAIAIWTSKAPRIKKERYRGSKRGAT